VDHILSGPPLNEVKMKLKLFLNRYIWFVFLCFWYLGLQAQVSQNRITYQTTFDATTQRFMVWVVPQYNTPNTNNPEIDERGATALVTIKVPTTLTISDIQNIRGEWDTAPIKLGPGLQSAYNGQGLDPNFHYYSIRKSPNQTSYGQFINGTPVSLFSFRTNGTQGNVSVISSTDPFVSVSDSQLGINVAPSFYSLSGQPSGGNQVPLEQFLGPSGNPANFIRANDDSYTGTPGIASTQNVLLNDDWNGGIPSSSQVVVSLVGSPTNGTAVVNPNGTVTFTPSINATGNGSYTYQICDISNPSICESATVTISISQYRIRYQTTYNAATQRYTVWVVPLYNTPNANNPDVNERGATAQVTLKVPATFTINDIQNINGIWENAPLKLGPGLQPEFNGQGLDPNAHYYVIGKSTSQTIYGPFSNGVPVPLFSFAGNCGTGGVGVIESNDPFVNVADAQFGLNVSPSFYSVSGQPSGGNQIPLEQYIGPLGGPANCLVATDDNFSATSGTSTSQAVLTNDLFNTSVPTTSQVSVSIVGQPSNGSVSVNPDGTITFTSSPGFVGSTSYVYRICDLLSPASCDDATVTVNVTCPIIQSPTLVSPVTYCVGQSAVALTATPSSGSSLRWYTSSTGGTGSPTAPVPNTSVAGMQSFWVSSFNSSTGCESSRIQMDVMVQAVPSVPTVLSPVVYCVGQGAVALSATAPSGSSLRWYTTATGGTGSTIAPTPSTTTAGTTSFYVSSLNSGGCESARVEIQVQVNAVPTAPVTGTIPTYCVGQSAVALTATPSSGSSLRWYTSSTGGTGSPTAPVPNTSVAGMQSFWVSSFNSSTGCESSRTRMDVTISEFPSQPIITSPITYCLNASPTALTASVGAGLTAVWYTTATGGTGTINAPTPATNATGTQSFWVSARNSLTLCESPRVQISVTVNDCRLIQAINDNLVLYKNSTQTVNVIQNDLPLTGILPLVTQVALVTSPQFGAATLSPTGVLSYTPSNPTFVGRDQVRYRVCDSGSPVVCSEAIVSIQVNDMPSSTSNNPPVAINDSYIGQPNTNITGNVGLNDWDPDQGQSLLYTLVTPPPTGSLNFQNNGQFVYTPVAGFSGSTTFTYQICDNGNPVLCNQAIAQIVVVPSNSPVNLTPIATDDYLRVSAGQSASLNLLTNDRDPEGGNLVAQSVLLLNPSHGTAVLNPNGQLNYTAQAGFSGIDQIVYRVCDQGAPSQCTQATVWIEIVNTQVRLNTKVFLQGALLGVVESNGLMRDDLRSKGLLPVTSPYSGFTSITSVGSVSSNVFNVIGANAIVDWVFIELRSSIDPKIVVDSRPALVQRDGDVVELDGISPITFQMAQANNYYVAIRHRNHLGVMTANPTFLGTVVNTLDFTLPSTQTWVPVVVNINQPQVVVNQGRALWAGNVLQDDRIIYQGSGNDIDPLYQRLINNPRNLLATPFFKARGYFNDDVNMDGEVIFQGSANDVEFIYLNVISNHPGNLLRQNSFVIRQQLP